jgi:outer membrane protein assembly factor BamB
MRENFPMRRFIAVSLVLAASAGLAFGARAADWRRFGYDESRSGSSPSATGITAASLATLTRQQIALPGTVDSSPIYLHDVPVLGVRHDVFAVTTTYGRTLALDADTGAILWQFVPPGIEGFEGTDQITTSTPVADPEKRYLYSASPDGKIHKLSVADGTEVKAGWPVVVTRDPAHEKIGPSLNLWGNLVLMATGGYIGDYPPYQGHVVAIDRNTGRIANVFNALCANRKGLLEPKSCASSGAAMWGRAGVVVEPASGKLLIATGNAPWDGKRDWGDSVLELSPDAGKLLQAYTPVDATRLEETDLDLGSTSPAVLTPHLALQGGKDGVLRLLSLDRLNGRTHAPAPVKGGELQILRAPRGAQVLTAPAVWRVGTKVTVFVANFAATDAYSLVLTPKPHLTRLWESRLGGSSPIAAGGLLYVYNPLVGGINVYNPSSPRPVATLPAGKGHWNSPIVVERRVALPEGDANDHAKTGVLDIYRLPKTP